MKLRGDSYLFFSGIEAHKKHLELLQSIPRKEYGEGRKVVLAHTQAALARLPEQLDK